MKVFQAEVVAELFHVMVFQFLEVKISKIVFQVVSRGFCDVTVNFGGCRGTSYTKTSKKGRRAGFVPSVIVDADIKKRINAQVQAFVEPCKPRSIGGIRKRG